MRPFSDDEIAAIYELVKDERPPYDEGWRSVQEIYDEAGPNISYSIEALRRRLDRQVGHGLEKAIVQRRTYYRIARDDGNRKA